MRVIGVLDLADGRAVHARRGERARYAPVAVPAAGAAAPVAAGDAPTLARWYADALGLAELYVADLDALAGRAPQREPLRRLAALGVPLLVDAAIAAPADAERTLADGAARAIVALESLPAVDALAAVVRAVGAERACFGLDLRAGVPVVRDGRVPARSPLDFVACAVDDGVRTVAVIDVARVGSGDGMDLGLLRRIRERWPSLELLAGGGVRDRRDLEALADAGIDGALLATALLEGRVTRAELGAVGARTSRAARGGGHAISSR